MWRNLKVVRPLGGSQLNSVMQTACIGSLAMTAHLSCCVKLVRRAVGMLLAERGMLMGGMSEAPREAAAKLT